MTIPGGLSAALAAKHLYSQLVLVEVQGQGGGFWSSLLLMMSPAANVQEQNQSQHVVGGAGCKACGGGMSRR
ncbi:hypothetical protein E2C01_002359 [Portunus trituberculatus]|uniref:Uncharacterized protein n=1 Tax=Portunus trituberculatus TaxID=210409 RepID=A0A5B7CK65_PORTR|nr:hypothetical protein [Portunus trituberculatus]